MDLDVRLEQVPQRRLPVWWDIDLHGTINMRRVKTWIAHYADRLPPGTYIDEAAILVPDPHHERLLENYLRLNHWDNFNRAEDVVFTNPFSTRYLVSYSFWRHLQYGNFRLEVMRLLISDDNRTGFSPLHEALLRPDGDLASVHQYPMPHLSFKPVRQYVEDRQQTWNQAYSQAVQHLKDKACLHAMTCQSSYGHFGYFLSNDAGRQIYLKPRVNLRDGE